MAEKINVEETIMENIGDNIGDNFDNNGFLFSILRKSPEINFEDLCRNVHFLQVDSVYDFRNQVFRLNRKIKNNQIILISDIEPILGDLKIDPDEKKDIIDYTIRYLKDLANDKNLSVFICFENHGVLSEDSQNIFMAESET